MLGCAVGVAGVLAVLCVPAGGLAAATERAPDLQCSGDYTGGTYGNVVVPVNGYCSFTDATIRGNVTVETAGGLDLSSSASATTVHGNLLVGTTAYANVNPHSVVEGTTTLNAADDVEVFQGRVHNVRAEKSNGLYFFQAMVEGNIVSNTAQSGGSISDSTIEGNVVIQRTVAGASSWYLDGPGQTIGGNVIITDNRVYTDVNTNQIKRNLVCRDNQPSSVNFANRIGLRSVGQCATENHG